MLRSIRPSVLIAVAGIAAAVLSQGNTSIIDAGPQAYPGYPVPPSILTFDAQPRQIRAGESTRLVWKTAEATTVSLTPGSSELPPNGSILVDPASSTSYVLTAVGTGGTAVRNVFVSVVTTPEVVVVSLPEAMVQGTNVGGATAKYALKNLGGASTMVSLSQEGAFFTQEPTSFSLDPGQTQTITITGEQRDTGSYAGRSILSGNGVPPGLSVPVRLLSAPEPTGGTRAAPEGTRVDVFSPEGMNPTGSVKFRNTGEAAIQGVLVSNVPWLIPDQELVEISPAETIEATFEIDRSRRPPETEIGSVEGELKLVFRAGGASGKQLEARNGAEATTSLVTVVDTSSPSVAPGQIPPLAPGEVALFIPGAGHVQGGTGLFFSDVTLVNLAGAGSLGNIRMYYTPTNENAQSVTTAVSELSANQPLPFADLVNTVFDSAATLGSLQIRSPNIDSLGVNANIFLRRASDQKIYGNTIPALRSDRSANPGESVFLTGLTRSGNNRTNLFIQETAGGIVTADIIFYDEAGQQLGVRTDVSVGPFRLRGLFYTVQDPILPDGTVSARITSQPSSTGRFAAYATPVDGISGDSWSLADWNALFDFSGSENMVVPVAGALQGGGNLYFRTDAALVNRGSSTASGILRYVTRPAEQRTPIDRTVTIGPQQSMVLEDLTTSLFEVDPTQFTLGYLKFFPLSGSMTLTSRNYATEGEDPGTFGTGVATLPITSSMSVGEIKRFGGVSDASLETVLAKVPGTFRSNLGLMETTGQASVTVRVTLHYSFSTGTTTVARGSTSKEITLQPNEFKQLNRLSSEILGAERDQYGDFDNMQIEVAVVGGGGAVTVFVSSVENESGDSVLRVN